MSQDTVVLNGEKVGRLLRLTYAYPAAVAAQVCLFYILSTRDSRRTSCSAVGTWAWRLRSEMVHLSGWLRRLSSTISPRGAAVCTLSPPSWYLLIQDPISISILITGISDAVSICIFLARVWHILAVILMGETAQSHVLSFCLMSKSISDLQTECGCLA